MRLAALLAALVLAAAEPPQPIATVETESPAPPGSAQPQLSVTRDGRVVLSWLEPMAPKGYRFRFAFGTLPPVASGFSRTEIRWTAPLTIAEGDRFFANWADVPSVVALPDGTLAAHWLQVSGPGKYSYDVMLRTSKDEGRTWSDPVKPHQDATETEHGFVSIVPWPGGGFGLVWLDGRDFAKHQSGGHGPEGMKAEMSLRARVFSTGRTRSVIPVGPEMVIDRRVCECCPTAAATTSRGVIVAYRDRSAREVRDISVARFEKGAWTAGRPVHADDWQIPGCPVNGPSLSAIGSRVALAWFAAPENDAHVRVTLSSDGGATFGRAIRVDDGLPLGRVDVELLPDGSALVGWLEYVKEVSGAADFRVRRISADGARGGAVTIARVTSERASGHPRMVRSGGQILLAWVAVGADKTPQVRVAVAPS
jgi:hypothetical protein